MVSPSNHAVRKAPRSKRTVVEDFRVETIQQAALRVITRQGLAGATIQEIAREAGIAKGTVYLYFDSREQLVERTAEMAFSQLQQRCLAAIGAPGGFTARLREVVRTKLLFFEAHREFFRLYLSLCHGQGDVRTSTRHKRRHHPQYAAHLATLARFLEAAIATGEARQGVDPARLALFLAESVNAIVLTRLTEPEPPPVEVDARWIAQALVSGLATRKEDLA